MENNIYEYQNIENLREDAYVKVVEIVKNLKDPCITYESRLILRQMLMVELDKMKHLKASKYNVINNFNTHEGREWLIGCVNVNEKTMFWM